MMIFEYNLICYYLWIKNYVIEGHEEELSSPDYYNFANKTIKLKAMVSYGDDGTGAVPWTYRRKYVHMELSIKRTLQNVDINENIEELIKEISTGDNMFISMTLDEKLMTIRNVWESISEKYGGYNKIEYKKVFLGYIDNENITEFSRKLHSFRHGNSKSLQERSSISKQEKIYMIDFGITLIKRAYFYIMDTSD